jgi:hypothetical protein
MALKAGGEDPKPPVDDPGGSISRGERSGEGFGPRWGLRSGGESVAAAGSCGGGVVLDVPFDGGGEVVMSGLLGGGGGGAATRQIQS